MSVELKHAITVDQSAWYIKLYVLVWEGDLDEISFCKLFWAYVFLPLGVLLRLAVIPPFQYLDGKLEARKAAREAKPLPAVKPHTPGRMHHLLQGIETGGSRLVMRASAIWDVVGLHGRVAAVAGRILVAIGILAGVAIAAGVVYCIVSFSAAQVTALVIFAVVLAGLLICAFHALGFFERLWNRVLTPAGHGVGAVGGSFWRVMATGYVAVKSNTCPRIEVNQGGRQT